MSQTKRKRTKKRQLGQFMTPSWLTRKIVQSLDLSSCCNILEPSFGTGNFIRSILEIIAFSKKQINIYGVELDSDLFGSFWNENLSNHGSKVQLFNEDFFRWFPNENRITDLTRLFVERAPVFDLIIGNPPFGGTFDSEIEDALDKKYGFRNGWKIKKETYSFFIIKSLDLLKENGKLVFICSDTFLTIKTMSGLRKYLANKGAVNIDTIDSFSDETVQNMVLITFTKLPHPSESITIDGRQILLSDIEKTQNYSWMINDDLLPYFDGQTLGEYLIATSGMTIGKNELFLKKIKDNTIQERFNYEYFFDPITIEREIERARLGKLSAKKMLDIKTQVLAGVTRKNIKVIEKKTPQTIELPDNDYKFYNKANNMIIFSAPTYAIFWKDSGEAVYTYKKNGNWYLHGIGGKKFFEREGITWQLVASRIHAKYLPAGYILDSGAPCAFLRPGVAEDELYFILGWLLSDLCNKILKTVINHTRNIQSKDVEKLPYPFWINKSEKIIIIDEVKKMIDLAIKQERKFDYSSPEIVRINSFFL